MTKTRLISAALSVALLASLQFSALPSNAVDATPAPTATPTPSPTLTPPVNPNAVGSCSANKALKNKALAKVYTYVVNLDTGRVLLDIGGSKPVPSASVMKLVTTSAAIRILPDSYRATTQVFQSPTEPGTIILKGGGDHTLSRLTGKSYSTYYKPARLSTLATAVKNAIPINQSIRKIILDASFFNGGWWNSAWPEFYKTSGDMARIAALMVDSDRKNPDLTSTKYSGKRSKDPVLSAGGYFKAALGNVAVNAVLEKGAVPVGARLIASVDSRPVTTWMRHALMVSDNTETEIIGFHAVKALGWATDWTSVTKMQKALFSSLGISTKKMVFKDGSGLSPKNRVTAKAITRLAVAIQKDAGPLYQIQEMLPVSGVSGSLVDRMKGAMRGKVRAKVGYIPGLFSLAGFVDTKDGSHLAFSIFAHSEGGRKVSAKTKPAIDNLMSRFYNCGAGLTK